MRNWPDGALVAAQIAVVVVVALIAAGVLK
jgi:hypothetical protein